MHADQRSASPVGVGRSPGVASENAGERVGRTPSSARTRGAVAGGGIRRTAGSNRDAGAGADGRTGSAQRTMRMPRANRPIVRIMYIKSNYGGIAFLGLLVLSGTCSFGNPTLLIGDPEAYRLMRRRYERLALCRHRAQLECHDRRRRRSASPSICGLITVVAWRASPALSMPNLAAPGHSAWSGHRSLRPALSTPSRASRPGDARRSPWSCSRSPCTCVP